MDIRQILKDRGIPELFGKGQDRLPTEEAFDEWRARTKLLLQEKEYGILPDKPLHLSTEITEHSAECHTGRKQE